VNSPGDSVQCGARSALQRRRGAQRSCDGRSRPAVAGPPAAAPRAGKRRDGFGLAAGGGTGQRSAMRPHRHSRLLAHVGIDPPAGSGRFEEPSGAWTKA